MPATTTCQFPGCERPVAAPTAETGRRPAYCDDPEHTRESAFRERQRLRRDGLLPPIEPADPHERPVSMAATSLALNVQALTSRAGELREVAARVEEAADTITDAAARELELDALRAGAELDVSRVRAELADQQRQLTADVQSARAQLAAEQRRATALDAQVATTRDSLEHAQADAEELRVGLVAAQEDRAALERTHAREVEALRGELERLRAELERSGAELGEAQRSLTEQTEHAAELQRELDTARRAESDTREALAAERAAREGAERSAVDARALAEQAQRTAEQLVASEQARAQESRAAAQEARSERDRALERAARAEKQAERLQDRVTGLEARLDAQQAPPAPKRARSRKPDSK